MVGMLILLSIFFFGASIVQVFHMNRSIEQAPEIKLDLEFNDLQKLSQDISSQELFQYIRWKSLAKLEAHSINRRYLQANQILLAQIISSAA